MALGPVLNPPAIFGLLKGASYDPTSKYVHSTDAKGHYESISVKLTPSMQAIMAELVASADNPGYRTPQDLVRDAIVHRLYYWAHNPPLPGLQRVVTAEMMLADIGREQVKIEMWARIVAQVRVTGEAMLKDGALRELSDMLERYDTDWDTNAFDLPLGKRREMRDVLDNLHTSLKNARSTDY